MAVIVTIAVLALGSILAVAYTRWRRRERRQRRWGRYENCMSVEEKYAAVEDAQSAGELRAMWAVWQQEGWAEDGLLHRHMVERIYLLGGHLDEHEVELLRTYPEHRGSIQAVI